MVCIKQVLGASAAVMAVNTDNMLKKVVAVAHCLHLSTAINIE